MMGGVFNRWGAPARAAPGIYYQRGAAWDEERLTPLAYPRIPLGMAVIFDPSEYKYKLQGLSQRAEVLRGFL